jgi:hypothetical protein
LSSFSLENNSRGGEKMKKKILLITAFLALAMLVTPIMAAPATRIEGVTLTTAIALIPDPATIIFADHNIVHNDGIGTGTATLNIPLHPSLHFNYYGVWNGTAKWTGFPAPDPEGTNVVRSTTILTCTDEGITGTFEGTLHTKTIGLPPPVATSYVEYNMVFHGTGDFQGQTLKLSYAGPLPVDFEGCLIIPK